MSTPYTPISDVEKNVHITMSNTTGRSGIYPSGEAHFFDNQVQTYTDTVNNPNNTSIFQYNQLATQFSNATVGYFIDDFTVFNPYRHNTLSYSFSTSALLQLAVNKFNIYSKDFRNKAYGTPTTTTTSNYF
jgi:hypothetical protein